MAEMAVGWTSDDLSVDLLEFTCAITKCNNFSWAHKGTRKLKITLKYDWQYNWFELLQIQWIEEQNHVFSSVILQRNLLELAIDDCSSREFWCWLTNFWITCTCHCNWIRWIDWLTKKNVINKEAESVRLTQEQWRCEVSDVNFNTGLVSWWSMRWY